MSLVFLWHDSLQRPAALERLAQRLQVKQNSTSTRVGTTTSCSSWLLRGRHQPPDVTSDGAAVETTAEPDSCLLSFCSSGSCSSVQRGLCALPSPFCRTARASTSGNQHPHFSSVSAGIKSTKARIFHAVKQKKVKLKEERKRGRKRRCCLTEGRQAQEVFDVLPMSLIAPQLNL